MKDELDQPPAPAGQRPLSGDRPVEVLATPANPHRLRVHSSAAPRAVALALAVTHREV
jgi:hypothetical protein